jgi:hypothetical protein
MAERCQKLKGLGNNFWKNFFKALENDEKEKFKKIKAT